jgi:transcriptional regulator GlxA family with amidase domain
MEIVFLFYEGMTALDVIGPHEILCRLPGAKVIRAAKNRGPIQTDSAGLTLLAEHALSDVSRADLLVVPGAGSATIFPSDPDILLWVRSIHQTTKWTTSICTGSLILGAAGLLSGLKATTHWAVMDRLPLHGAIPTQARIVEDGKVLTAAGVSAGIDMALTIAAKICGPQLAQALQLALEYDPEPPFDVGSPKKAAAPLLEALRARMSAKFEAV